MAFTIEGNAEMKHRTVTRNGKQYVVVEDADFAKLAEGADVENLPAFPPVDANGNSPAIEFARVSIARQLITERRAAGLSQAELARRAGIRVETLSRLENAKHSADVATMKRIDAVLTTVNRTKKDSGGKSIATLRVGEVEIEHNYATRATRTFIPLALAKDSAAAKRKKVTA
jgi:transcriptional regulator with XRE-family HTH domain